MFEVQLTNSTAIRLVAYNTETNTMRVMFRSGLAYDYANVAREFYDDLVGAESVGRYFNLMCRAFRHNRLENAIAVDFLLRVLEAAADHRVFVAA